MSTVGLVTGLICEHRKLGCESFTLPQGGQSERQSERQNCDWPIKRPMPVTPALMTHVASSPLLLLCGCWEPLDGYDILHCLRVKKALRRLVTGTPLEHLDTKVRKGKVRDTFFPTQIYLRGPGGIVLRHWNEARFDSWYFPVNNGKR